VSFPAAAGAAVPMIVVAFIAAALVALLTTPAVGAFVRRRGIVDQPNARRVNRRPLPRGGGVAVVFAFVVVGGGLALFSDSIPGMPARGGIQTPQLLGLFGGAVLAAAIGAIDDLLDLRARWQLLGQVALAAVAVGAGISVAVISNPFGPHAIDVPTLAGAVFTAVWIVGMINSINFIDGLDGLSSGIALIAAVTLGVISLSTQVDPAGQPFVAVLCFVFAGALLGFLRWNFHPAVIFQGTAGVMFLGYALAVLSILGSAKVVVALLVLGVPIIDSFWVIVRRVSGGRSPFNPDRGHIHHRLLDLGLSHRATVLLIYAICATLGLMSLLVSDEAGVYAFLGAFVGVGLLIFVLARAGNEALEPTSYDEEARP
jgi:UDP-GlcNAc:undecaprenyl-phosphate/decaprenyl-phosphate GlcNAc-1-phosphate transferase